MSLSLTRSAALEVKRKSSVLVMRYISSQSVGRQACYIRSDPAVVAVKCRLQIWSTTTTPGEAIDLRLRLRLRLRLATSGVACFLFDVTKSQTVLSLSLSVTDAPFLHPVPSYCSLVILVIVAVTAFYCLLLN